jgi:quinoprotein dehydrogenase-associated probable ABC transporter substrate-binding protein
VLRCHASHRAARRMTPTRETSMTDRRSSAVHAVCAMLALCWACVGAPSACAQGAPAPNLPNNDGADNVLRVCADPNNMPLSNDKGEGFENKIAAAMAKDFGYKLEYTYFPQRMGFVRHTLRDKVDNGDQFKCDLIIGVPHGYDMTSTTRPWLHSTYAMVFIKRPEFANINTPADLLKLPPDQLKKLKLGIFSQTPAVDWLLNNDLIDQAVSYRAQSGDPNAFPGEMIQHDLAQGNVDVVFVWGPIAGYFAKQASDRVKLVPFPPQPGIRFDYEISMGVRYGEKAWHDKVDQWIATHQVLIGRVQVCLVLDLPAEIAKDLHRAQVRDMRPWRIGQPAIVIDDHIVDAVGRQQRSTCRPSGSCTDDKHISRYFIHLSPPILFSTTLRY